MGVITRNITKDFPAGDDMVRVLHGIDIEVENGKLTMLVGPSGCGKTTLLSIITGILSPTDGVVEINGVNITALKGAEKVKFRRTQLGFIFQQYNLLPSLTCAENAAIPLIAGGMNMKFATEEATEVLAQIGMKGQENKIPQHLSGGQMQRVAIARALVHNPRLVVCDEPTSALDAHTGHKVMELLRKAATNSDRAVIVVTHDSRIYEFADKIIHMNDGKIIKEEEVTKP